MSSAQLTSGFLTSKELLRGLPVETLVAFEKLQHKSSYPEGYVLFNQNQAPDGLFLIHAGQAKISVVGHEGQPLAFQTARAGNILGLSATVSGQPYVMSAETLCASEVGFIARDDFTQFLHSHPDFAFRVVELLSHTLDATLEQASFLRRPPARKPRSEV